MRSLSREEALSFLRSIGVPADLAAYVPTPRFLPARDCRVFEVEFANHFTAAQDMARELLTSRAQSRFPGGLIWLYQREDWPIADYTLERFLKSYGVACSSRIDPIIVMVNPDEAMDAIATMGLMMTYGWDCFFVAADAAYIVKSCNEMILTLVTTSDETFGWYEPIIKALEFEELRGERNPCV